MNNRKPADSLPLGHVPSLIQVGKQAGCLAKPIVGWRTQQDEVDRERQSHPKQNVKDEIGAKIKR